MFIVADLVPLKGFWVTVEVGSPIYDTDKRRRKEYSYALSPPPPPPHTHTRKTNIALKIGGTRRLLD